MCGSGLGVGTTPAALITHGIDTTVVEIDPVVYEFATKYFTLPKNFTPELRDAVEYVKDAKNTGSKFDYIVHDVFTGGVEPVDLFTLEFMHGLHDLLADDGVIAVVSQIFSTRHLKNDKIGADQRVELRWGPLAATGRICDPHSHGRVPIVQDIPRVRAEHRPVQRRLHQHGHILQEIHRPA